MVGKLVKRRNYPISRQNFANAFAETPNLNLQVCHMCHNLWMRWVVLLLMQIYPTHYNVRWVWCDFDGDHVCGVALLQQNKLRRYLTPPLTSTPPTILLHSNPLPATQYLHSEYHRQERGSSHHGNNGISVKRKS